MYRSKWHLCYRNRIYWGKCGLTCSHESSDSFDPLCLWTPAILFRAGGSLSLHFDLLHDAIGGFTKVCSSKETGVCGGGLRGGFLSQTARVQISLFPHLKNGNTTPTLLCYVRIKWYSFYISLSVQHVEVPQLLFSYS